MTIEDLLERNGLTIVERAVADGGSAIVHKARVVRQQGRLPAVDTFIAVKEYRRTLLEVPGQLQRVRQEADIGQRLEHPNLARTYGLIDERDSDGHPLCFLLLEWIDGGTLESWYHQQPAPVPWSTLSSVCIDITNAVAALHNEGILHRDIKPENVMLRGAGGAVLMDVGVAEVTGDNRHTLHTAIKDFVGSTRYASPQFILGEEFTPADDVYSLGATFFLLLTGKRIYSEIQRKPVIPIAVVNSPPKIPDLADGVPRSLRFLLDGCLSRDRNRRPALQEVLESLTSPDDAKYLSKELQRQGQESRSFEVIHVFPTGKMFLADLAGTSLSESHTFKVVRSLQPVHVPSYNRKIAPEVEVGLATLKHVHQNVGHFVLVRKRWVEGSSKGIFGLGSSGYWTEDELGTLTVEKGDRVLKDDS